MKFHFQQISDYGTKNPIVARLCLQVKDIIQFFPLNETQKENVFGTMCMDVMPRIMTCYKINEEIGREIIKCKEKINKNGILTQSQERTLTLPSILNLNERVETFLYSSKSALRDFIKIFNVIFNANLEKKARYDLVYEWAKGKFGENDNLTKVLKQDHDLWIQKIVKMRNAIEHPGGSSGHLHIHNFRIPYINSKPLIVEPSWNLNSAPATPIIGDMTTFINNLLTFCEEILILCLEKLDNKLPVKVVEIPESKRRPECPIRFRVTMDFK